MKKTFIITLISVVLMFGLSAFVCNAVDTKEQNTTEITTTENEEIIEHLENIEAYTFETFKWVSGCCFCLITLLVILVVIIICKIISRLIM